MQRRVTAVTGPVVALAFVAAAWGQNGASALVGDDETYAPGQIIIRFVEQPAPDALAAVKAVLGQEVEWYAPRHAPHAKDKPRQPHPLSYHRVAMIAPESDVVALAAQISALSLDADRLLQLYATLAYHRTGSYVGAAEKLGLDRRTVKAKIDSAYLATLRQQGGAR